MYSIKMPDGNYLEGEFNLSFELNNQVFSSGDSSTLAGSFSFPTDVDLTPVNRVLLGHPDQVNNAKSWQTFPGTWIEVYNVPLFYGTLQIKKASALKASITVIAAPLFDVREMQLHELDYGDPIEVANWKVLMYDTANIPEQYDYCFFPIFNPDHNDYPDTDHDYEKRSWQNYFNVGSTEYDLQSGAITPFLKLKRLLQLGFQKAGWGIANDWQTNIELSRIYLYHNFDARELNGNFPSSTPELPAFLTLKNHVPRIPFRELLRKTMAHFCLGLFVNPFSQKVSLVPVQTIIRRATRIDWTEYLDGDLQLDESSNPIKAYNYPQPFDISPAIPKPHNAVQIKTVTDLNLAISAQPDNTTVWYYTEDGHALIRIVKSGGGFVYDPYIQNQGVYPHGDNNEVFDTGVETFRSLFGATTFGHYQAYNKTSHWNADNERVMEDSPFVFLMYRGIQNDSNGLAPIASNHVWMPSGSAGARVQITADGASLGDAEYSLNWFGEFGLYNKFHSLWNEMLNKNKPVSAKLSLPVKVLTEFTMDQKVRIGSMDYFVKRLRIGKALGNGLLLVEASLVSTI